MEQPTCLQSNLTPNTGSIPPVSILDSLRRNSQTQHIIEWDRCYPILPDDAPDTDPDWQFPEVPRIKCPNERLIVGTCNDHGSTRYMLVPCKARDCDVCGPISRLRIAARIDYGIQTLGRCQYVVFTFATPAAAACSFKPIAVRRIGRFIAWLRKRLNFHFETVLTWELQPKSGRLHANLIFNYDGWLPYSEMIKKWGAILRCQPVTDATGVSEYVTKVSADQPSRSLGRYCAAKDYQSVPREWGRRVSFSRGWPKREKPKTLGKINWKFGEAMDTVKLYRQQLEGDVIEVGPGVYTRPDEICSCFHVIGAKVTPFTILDVFEGAKNVSKTDCSQTPGGHNES